MGWGVVKFYVVCTLLRERMFVYSIMCTQGIPQVRLPAVSTDDIDSESDSDSSSDTSSVTSCSTVLSFEAPSVTSISSSSESSDDNESGMDEPSVEQNPLHDVEEEQLSNLSDPKTYRFNGDNMDYTEVKRYQTSEAGNKSQHFFQYYAVKDRIDFSHLSTKPPDVSALSKRQLCQSMLPSESDDATMRRNISFLVARVLCEHIPYFQQTYDGGVKKHIKHRFYQQMSSKSEVVC